MEKKGYRIEIKIKGNLFGFRTNKFKSTEDQMMQIASEIFEKSKKEEHDVGTKFDDILGIGDCIPKQTEVNVFGENDQLVISYQSKT